MYIFNFIDIGKLLFKMVITNLYANRIQEYYLSASLTLAFVSSFHFFASLTGIKCHILVITCKSPMTSKVEHVFKEYQPSTSLSADPFLPHHLPIPRPFFFLKQSLGVLYVSQILFFASFIHCKNVSQFVSCLFTLSMKFLNIFPIILTLPLSYTKFPFMCV